MELLVCSCCISIMFVFHIYERLFTCRECENKLIVDGVAVSSSETCISSKVASHLERLFGNIVLIIYDTRYTLNISK